jgi:hypothetical protein
MEEIAPNRFLLHNEQISGLVRGEGQVEGRIFILTTWRRAGLIARLRERTLRVLTLLDQIDALPALPSPAPIGAPGRLLLGRRIDRYSVFDVDELTWSPVTSEIVGGAQELALRDGTVLRRRKGRGASMYALVIVGRDDLISLRPFDETEALLMGYAQAAMQATPRFFAPRHDDTYLLPDILLPPAHRTLLERFATRTDDGWSTNSPGWPLAQELFARLGLQLELERGRRTEDG